VAQQQDDQCYPEHKPFPFLTKPRDQKPENHYCVACYRYTTPVESASGTGNIDDSPDDQSNCNYYLQEYVAHAFPGLHKDRNILRPHLHSPARAAGSLVPEKARAMPTSAFNKAVFVPRSILVRLPPRAHNSFIVQPPIFFGLPHLRDLEPIYRFHGI
jgi:hypothetical protein